MAIRVEINPGTLHPEHHDVSIGTKIVSALKAAGIPVIASAFVVQGIKRGVLSYYQGMGAQHTYSWREGDKDNSHEGYTRTDLGDGVVVFKNGVHDDEL